MKQILWSRRSLIALLAGIPLLPKVLSGQHHPQADSDVNQPVTWAEKKVLIFGDSITDTKGRRENWVQPAMAALGNPQWVNYADGGAAFRQRTLQGIDDMPTQLKMAAGETHVDAVIVALGTNEYHRPAPPLGNNAPIVGSFEEAMNKPIDDLSITDTMYDAIRYAFHTIRQRWDGMCYVLLPIQRAKWRWKQVDVLYQALEEMALSYGFELIDGRKCGIVSDFEQSGKEGRDLRDGLHPNDQGHRKIARLVATTIKNTW